MANGYDESKITNQNYVNGKVLEKLSSIEKKMEETDVKCAFRRKEIDGIKRALYIAMGTLTTAVFLLIAFREVMVRYIADKITG